MSSREEHDWLACRYLLDEMSAEEAAMFEARLGADEEAAAALARGAVLVATVSEAGRVPRDNPTVASRPGRPRRGRVAGLAAVAASIGLVWLLGVSQSTRQWGGRGETSGDAVELVSIWRESGGEPPAEAESVGVEDDVQPTADDVPDWLMAAVALDAPETDDEILEN